jgi:FkbM family methyltransferase
MVAEAMKHGDGHLEDHLVPNMGVLDIGANAGMLAATYAKKVGPTGYVLAVEPNPETFEQLQHGVREWPQVKAVHSAVGSTGGDTVIYLDGLQTSRWQCLTGKAKGTAVVPMTTLDALAATVPNLRGVKIDVQGGEMDVLDGASETLSRPDIVWQIEVWPKGLEAAGTSAAALCDRLAAAGLRPVKRTWDLVRDQVAQLSKQGSYLDLVLTHG